MGRSTTMQSLFLNDHQEFLKGGEGSKDTVVSTPKITPWRSSNLDLTNKEQPYYAKSQD